LILGDQGGLIELAFDRSLIPEIDREMTLLPLPSNP
jgi:hypothetical protein